MNMTVAEIQKTLGEYTRSFHHFGVFITTDYPSPFPVTLSSGLMELSVGNGIAYDENGQITRIDPSDLASKKKATIPDADPGLARWDLLVIRFKETGETLVPKPSDPIQSIYLNLTDDFELLIREGVPSLTPAYPAKQSGDIILAGVRVPAAAAIGTDCTVDYLIREKAKVNYAELPKFKQEIPVGTKDGSNVDFTISEEPIDVTSFIVFKNSLALSPSEYTLTGSAIQFSVAPESVDDLYCFFIVASETSINPLSGYQEVPGGVVDGLNDTFTLTGVPADQKSMFVWKNGLVIPITSWALVQTPAGSQIKMLAGEIPEAGDSLYCFYFVNPATLGSGPSVPAPSGGGAIVPYGTYLVGIAINPAVGVLIASDQRQMRFVRTAGGAQLITANPQVQAGTTVGQELFLAGTSDADYPTLEDGNGLALNGPINLKKDAACALVWTGAYWMEVSRR